MAKLLLLDGNAMLFRAYYATIYSRPMSTSSGIPTNAIYAFVNMLNKAIEVSQPTHLMVAWDADGQTFRKQQYPDYKGTRKELDPALIAQFPIAREFLDAANITRYEISGYEADDIIGSLSKQVDCETVIFTGDKDLLQLVDDKVSVILMRKGISDLDVYTPSSFQTAYQGLEPKQIIDLKGLMGDSSDNIPGVGGVGEKTAMKLLLQYHSVEGVYEHIDEIKGKLKEKLVNDHEQALMSKDLATIYRDMDLPFGLEATEFDGFAQGVHDFYVKYEMRTLARKSSQVTKIEKVETVDKLYQPEPYLISLDEGFVLFDQGKPVYLPDEHAHTLAAFLSQPYISWDAKELLHHLDRLHLTSVLPLDMHLAVFLLESQTNLDLLIEHLELQLPYSFHDLSLKKEYTLDKAIQTYGALLTHIKAHHQEWLARIDKEGMHDLFYELEQPLIQILFEMEKQGMLCDKAVLKELNEQASRQLDQLTQTIYELAGKHFNLNSPKQLGEVLFDDLGLSGGGKKRSTSAEVLESLVGTHPIIQPILEYRKLSKLQSTYLIGLEKHILEDGRIHTTFNQTATQTGRLSSIEPNLQNISIRDEQSKMIRKAFKVDDQHVLISADYSQVELRVLAHMANEQHMIDAFKHGQDIHASTAALIFDEPLKQVTSQQRRQAKTVNFGIVYGQTEYGLASQLGISRLEAKQFIKNYLAKYPSISRFMDELIEQCQAKGYVNTLFGRRRYIPEINDKNFMTREFGKRAAMNAPIQGTAADLIKKAMLAVDKAMKEAGVQSKLLLQIHDELIFEVPKNEVDTMMSLVKKAMEKVHPMSVPLLADLSYGQSWYEAK